MGFGFCFVFLRTKIQTLYFLTEDNFLGKFYIYWVLEILWPYVITTSPGVVDTCLTGSCLALNLKMIQLLVVPETFNLKVLYHCRR